MVRRLQREGFPVLAAAHPLRGVDTDAAYLDRVLLTISGPIVLAGHSYGTETVRVDFEVFGWPCRCVGFPAGDTIVPQMTVADLAHELGVSARTLHRDLAFLRNLGMPVDGDRGRGGGLRLEHGWSLGRVHLSEIEAIGLLLSLTIAEKVGSPLLLDDARSIARKIAVSFAPAQARRILAIRRRILVGASASALVLSSYTSPSARVAKPLLDAFANRRVAVISYQDQHARITEREIELQYLYYNVPVWYALAWDRLRNNVRSFRIDRIKDDPAAFRDVSAPT